jgi:hypothetical protein
VFTCSLGDWQVQVSPGARSDLGGAGEAYYAICDEHRAHVVAEHTPDELDQMEAELLEMMGDETPG